MLKWAGGTPAGWRTQTMTFIAIFAFIQFANPFPKPFSNHSTNTFVRPFAKPFAKPVGTQLLCCTMDVRKADRTALQTADILCGIQYTVSYIIQRTCTFTYSAIHIVFIISMENTCIYIYIYIYTYIHIHIYKYIYIYQKQLYVKQYTHMCTNKVNMAMNTRSFLICQHQQQCQNSEILSCQKTNQLCYFENPKFTR